MEGTGLIREVHLSQILSTISNCHVVDLNSRIVISERVQATLELFVYSRVGIKLTSGESCNENIFLPAFVPGHRGTFDRVEIELKLDAVDWIVVRYGTSRVRTWFGCQLSCEQMQSIIACQSW